MQKRLIQYDENSRLLLTVEGAEFLEQAYRTNLVQKRLPAPIEK